MTSAIPVAMTVVERGNEVAGSSSTVTLAMNPTDNEQPKTPITSSNEATMYLPRYK
jgi:hypothetical protein